MIGSSADEPGDEPHSSSAGGERAWRHPSEVGLAQRGHTDRRRSRALVGGLLAGGIGLLLVGLYLGATDPLQPASTATAKTRSASVGRSVATVTAVSGTDRVDALGIVVDEHGRVAAPAELLDGAEELWARCGSATVRATVLGVDHVAGVAVLQMSESSGRPAVAGNPEPGGHLRAVALVTAADGDAAMTVSAAVVGAVGTEHFELGGPSQDTVAAVSSTPERAAATSTSPGRSTSGSPAADTAGGSVSESAPGPVPRTSSRLLFDTSGRFVGMTVAGRDRSDAPQRRTGDELAMTSRDLMDVVAELTP